MKNGRRLKGAKDRNEKKEMGVKVYPKEKLVFAKENTMRLMSKTWQLMESS